MNCVGAVRSGRETDGGDRDREGNTVQHCYLLLLFLGLRPLSWSLRAGTAVHESEKKTATRAAYARFVSDGYAKWGKVGAVATINPE